MIEPAYSVVCPKCRAVIGGKCLDKIKDGSKYIETPHAERIDLAKVFNEDKA